MNIDDFLGVTPIYGYLHREKHMLTKKTWEIHPQEIRSWRQTILFVNTNLPNPDWWQGRTVWRPGNGFHQQTHPIGSLGCLCFQPMAYGNWVLGQFIARPSFLRHATDAKSELPGIPATFDARKQWPKCNSIGLIRNQAGIGSRFCLRCVVVEEK